MDEKLGFPSGKAENPEAGAFVIAMIWMASEIFLGLIARSKGGSVKRADKFSIWLILSSVLSMASRF